MKRIKDLFDFRNNSKELVISLVLTVSLFVGGIASYAFALTQGTTLTVTVATALTFTLGNNNFSTINPGTPQYATSTLYVTTNDASGYTVGLMGTNTGSNLKVGSYAIPDQPQWVPGGATTTVGNAVAIASLANSGNVLAMRVMTASSSNGVALLAPTWWGANDAAGALWAGIATSSINTTIGTTGVNSYSASTQINTVQYYLNVATTQQTGTYNAPITYTVTGI